MIDGIIHGMMEENRTVEAGEHHAVRASHAKSTGLVVGTLSVDARLAAELGRGLFARPDRYAVAIWFAHGPGETLDDRVSTHRGLSITVFGVAGAKRPGHSDDIQDFVLTSGKTFSSGTAQEFRRDGTVIGKATGLPEGVKNAVSSTARNFNSLLHAFGAKSAMADFFGHPFSHPLAEAYFSQAPLRFGGYVAKLGDFPVSAAQDA